MKYNFSTSTKQKINLIKDKAMADATIEYYYYNCILSDYGNLIIKNTTMTKSLRVLINIISDTKLSELNWEKIIELSNKSSEYSYSLGYLFDFIYFLIDKNLYLGDYKNELLLNKETLVLFANNKFQYKTDLMNVPNIKPNSIIIFPNSYNNSSISTAVTNTTQEVINIISVYLKEEKLTGLRRKDADMFIELSKYFCETNTYVKSINYFSDEVFEKQVSYIIEHDKSLNVRIEQTKNTLGSLIKFYTYIQRIIDKSTNENFKIYDLLVLKYPGLMQKIIDGYKIINYNIYEHPTYYPKMLLKENNMDIHSTSPKDRLISFNCESITNEILRNWYIEFFWKCDDIALYYRHKTLSGLRDFILLLEKFNKEDSINITVTSIMTYKANILQKNTKDANKARNLSIVKKFLNFLETNEYTTIDPIVYRLFKHKDDKPTHTENISYSKEEIKKLIDEFKLDFETEDNECRKLLYQLHYYILAILSISEIRLSSILDLKTDCLVKTLSKKGHDEYKVIVKSKVSYDDFDEYNVTSYVKSLIEEAIEVTNEIRQIAGYIEKNYVFIYKRYSFQIISIVRDGNFSKHLNRVCQRSNIRNLSSTGIRNYYQQEISDYIIKNNFDPMLIEKLGKHSINVHLKHYDNVDIREFCTRYYNVDIGSVYLKGRVSKKEQFTESSTVANRCGNCTLSTCNLFGKLDCLMCENFVTTLSCIPYFEDSIALIDKKILDTKLNHEKEFLFSKKKLLVAYLEKLIILSQEV